MQMPPPLPMLAPIWRRRVFVLAGLALLAGCANGDFGEVRPSLVRDDTHDWLSRYAIAGKPTSPSPFELTDDERALRDLAYPLIEQPYDRQQWYSVAREYGLIKPDRVAPHDRTAYAKHLFGDNTRSPTVRYARLIDDIRNDTTRLPQFFETASRVHDIDLKRRKSFNYISGLSMNERNKALRRTYENQEIIKLVLVKLSDRVASYRFALERLVLMTPSPMAADAEHALNNLRGGIAHYRIHGAPAWVREQSLAAAR